MLQLLETANGNTAIKIGGNLKENMNELFPQIIDKYRTQFQPSKKIPRFNSISMKNNVSVNRKSGQIMDCGINSEQLSVNRDVLVPSKPIGHIHATFRRKKPMVEQVK